MKWLRFSRKAVGIASTAWRPLPRRVNAASPTFCRTPNDFLFSMQSTTRATTNQYQKQSLNVITVIAKNYMDRSSEWTMKKLMDRNSK
eukprot:5833056-Amphidinium_carterae.2